MPGVAQTETCTKSCLQKLDVERNRYFLAYQDATGFKRRIPVEPEIFSIDLRRRRKANARVAPRIFRGRRWPFHIEHNRTRLAMNRQIACHRVPIIATALDAGRFESKRRELFDIEEVGALQVRVTLRLAPC